MNDDPRTRLKRWLASGEARLEALSLPQRELWETSPVPPGDPANHICSVFEISGPVTRERMAAALGKVVARQAAMRTAFLPGKDRPLQMVRSSGEAALRYRPLDAAQSTTEGLAKVMEKSFREPFDMMRGPLYRLDMFRRGQSDHVFAFTIHHAVADGWTLGAFIQDLFAAYLTLLRKSGNTESALPPLPTRYSQWAASERARWDQPELERHTTYWKARLAGSRQLFDATAGDRSTPLEQWVTSVPASLADAARELGRASGTTLFNTLLAAFQVALCRWTGAADILVGTPVANRNKTSLGDTMGYFAGVVPLRGKVDRAMPFTEHLATVQRQTMDAFAHAMPFAELAKALGENSTTDRHALFDTRFALQNHPVPEIVLPGISTKLRTCATGTARFDLGCELTEDAGGFELVWLHRPAIVPDAAIRELDALYRAVLEAVCRQPGIRSASTDLSVPTTT